ncbi:MAG: TIGR04053 family radical SAM/SPASM domain-containing protein [bacterium]
MKWDIDFAKAPLLVIWETTRSCELSCQHCRASAENRRDPRELTTDEGRKLIDDVKAMGTPLMIFTGGDPLQRDDLEDLIRHAKSVGLRAGSIPATTNRLTLERVKSLKDAGLDQMAVSLDGPNAARHDAFRRVEGSFAKAMQGAAWARDVGLPLQVNSCFGAWNFHEFDEMAALVESLGIVFWEVFFLVPTGRGSNLQCCTPEQFEILFDKLYKLSQRAPFIVKVTEGQHYKRFVAQCSSGSASRSGAPHRGAAAIGASSKPVNSGNGFCFVDHIGDVQPSGFLPITCGNVRTSSIIDIYRDSPVFRDLRDLQGLKGRCGICEFREVCGGGSRARAYAVTGDFLAEEPFCAYQPKTSGVIHESLP